MALAFRRRSNGLPPEPWPGARVDIVPMRRRHVRDVLPIEQTVFPRPWTAGLYLSELSLGASRLYYVALAETTVVGYAGAMLVAGECHITTVGVSLNWQRHHVGLRLLHRLVSDARERGTASLTLEVRVTNTGAQRLYHEFGFAPAGIRKNYYAEVNEDGLVMWAGDVDSDAYGERLRTIASRMEHDIT